MKKLLLINPIQNHTISGNLPSYVDEARGNIPPLGLLYTASAVERRGDWEVQFCDMSVGEHLDDSKPDLVGITATTFTLLDVLELAKQIKDRWPDVPIVLGGIHPTIYPEETANLPNIDCAFAGESEVTFPQVIDLIATKGARVIHGEVPDISKLPMPAYHLMDTKRYYSVIGSSVYLTSIFTSRGCPYKCIFCHRETMGKTFRARSADQVIEEIRYIMSLSIREILFYDDTFTVSRKRVIDICRRIYHEGLRIRFDIRARVDHIDSEVLQCLQAAGCKRIHYGVEASNDRMLEVLRKGITVDLVRRVFQMTRRAGIETLAYFIIGSPTETRKDILETMSLAKELKPDYCHFGIMTPYPATPLYKIGLGKGLYGDYWLRFAQNPTLGWQAPYWPELHREELLELLGKAYRSFYCQPSQIMKEVVKTKSTRQLIKKGISAAKMVARR